MALLQKRIEVCNQIIRSSIEQFAEQNKSYFLDIRHQKTVQVQRMDRVNREMYVKYADGSKIDVIAAECAQRCAVIVDASNKAKPDTQDKQDQDTQDEVEQDEAKKEMKSFRECFNKKKNWFDQKKVGVLAFYFWPRIIDLAETVNPSSHTFPSAHIFLDHHIYSLDS